GSPAGPVAVPAPASATPQAHGPRLADHLPPPKYPAEAAATGLDGRVMLKVLVGVDGSVADGMVEHSEPEGVFDAATVEAARQWRFTPRVEDGKAVEGWVRVPVDFQAPDPAPAAD